MATARRRAGVDCAGTAAIAARAGTAGQGRGGGLPRRRPAGSGARPRLPGARRQPRPAWRRLPARRCSSICGRPGACPAGPRCRRSTGWRRRSAATASRWSRSMSIVRNPERARAFLDEIGVKQLAFYADPSFAIFKELKKRGLALRPADDDPGRRQGLPYRRRRGPGRMGFGGRQGADQGGDRARLECASGDLPLGEGRVGRRPALGARLRGRRPRRDCGRWIWRGRARRRRP